MITKEQAIDILEKFDFFQGQRAGRELWNDKPFEVQEQDIKDFARDVALLKEYIADVIPKSEVDEMVRQWKEEANCWQNNYITELRANEQIKAEVAREIFEEIESLLGIYTYEDNYGEYISTGLADEFAELKNKYTEEKE